MLEKSSACVSPVEAWIHRSITFSPCSSLLNHSIGPLACPAIKLTSDARNVVFPVSGLANRNPKSPRRKEPIDLLRLLSLQRNPGVAI